jgi:hypothetical protein
MLTLAIAPAEGAVILATPAGGAPLSIEVDAPAAMNDTLVDAVMSEADAIWRPMGVMLRWHRAVSGPQPCRCDLTLVIEPAVVPGHHATSLGWIDFADGVPDGRIHLSPQGAEALIRQMPDSGHAARASHDALVARALGRAFSHELGHYLLDSTAHSAHGLMRSEWPIEEATSLPRDAFALEPPQRRLLQRHLADRRDACPTD